MPHPSRSNAVVSFQCPHQQPVCPVCHVPHPSHSPQFDHPNDIWWSVQIMKLSITRYSYVTSVPRRPKCLPHRPVLEHPQPIFRPQCERPSSTPVWNNRHVTKSVRILFIRILYLSHNLYPKISSNSDTAEYFSTRIAPSVLVVYLACGPNVSSGSWPCLSAAQQVWRDTGRVLPHVSRGFGASMFKV